MAIIISDHMMKTEIILANDHAGVIGIMSFAKGFVMFNADHTRKIHPARDVNTSRLNVTDSDFIRLNKLNSLLFNLIFV